MSDDSLVERFSATQEMRFFEEIWERHGPSIYNCCAGVLHRKPDAQDVTGDVFIKARAALLGGQYKPGNLRGWLVTMARHRCINMINSANWRYRASIESHEIAAHTADPELKAEVESVLDKLSDEQRIAIKLKYVEERTYEEVAEHQGWTLDMVKAHLQNGRRMFEKYWKEKASKTGA